MINWTKISGKLSAWGREGGILTNISLKKNKIETSECTGTRDGSETSLNTVVHENVKVYEIVCEIFLKFFQELPQLIFL